MIIFACLKLSVPSPVSFLHARNNLLNHRFQQLNEFFNLLVNIDNAISNNQLIFHLPK